MGSRARPSVVDRAVSAFAEWFESAACVWQTLAFCLAIFALEVAFPHVDPNHFGYLLILTVYSGVTQPALAYSSRRAANLVTRAIETIDVVVDDVHLLVRNSADSLDAQFEAGVQMKALIVETERNVLAMKEEMSALRDDMSTLKEEIRRHHDT